MRIYNVFIKNGLMLTLSTIILRTISIIFNIFLSNEISSSDLGSWSIIMSIFSFLLTISLSGVNLSSTRLIAKERSYGSSANISNIISDCFKYCLFFSALSVLIMVCFKGYILSIISPKKLSINLIYLLAIALPFCSLSSCLDGFFMAIDDIKTIIASDVIEVISQIAITLIFYHCNFFNNTRNICLSLILSLIISDFISFMYLLKIYYNNYRKQSKITKTGKSYTKEILRISLPVALTTYIKSGLSTLKTTMIPMAFMRYGFSSEESFSYYGLISGTVLTLILFPFTFIQSYNNLLVPKLSSYNPEKNINTIKRITKKSISLTFIFALITSIIFIIFAQKIDDTFYKTLDVTYYIKVLAPIIIYIYMDNVVDSILKSVDAQIYVVLINIIDLILTISLINIFIPKYGISSYIIILYISEIFNIILSMYVLDKKIKNFSNKSL